MTILFTDIVQSTALKQSLGDRTSAALFDTHHDLVRKILRTFADAHEIETAGDSFLLTFATPSQAVQFALELMERVRLLGVEHGMSLQERIGIHLGEVVIKQEQAQARDLYGIQIDVCARVMALAQAGQILMTRPVFDSARQVLKGGPSQAEGESHWLNHGRFRLKGLEEAVEICEVRLANHLTKPPPDVCEKARREIIAGEDAVLGWRPAIDQRVPNTKWILEQKLGEGGFGEVWLARHQSLKGERRVFKFSFRADRVRSLKREMTLFRILKERVGDHPNIVRLLEVNFDEPPFYVVMDHVEGADLKTWLGPPERGPAVPLAVRLELVAQVADALQAAHDAGVIHRDVKPSNILVSSPPISGALPTARLTDFGIGQVVSKEALAGVTQTGFTQTIGSESSSSQTGSQLYMAPELLAGKPASSRSDIYALGVVLYQLVVGDLTRPLTTDWPESVSDPLLREDLKSCFAGNPQDRFAGACQLAMNLRTLDQRREAKAAELAAVAARERAAYRKGMAQAVFAAMVILVLIASLAAVAFYQSRRANEEKHKAEQAAGAEKQQRLRAEQNFYDSLLREAHALRTARTAGYRENVFRLLEQAQSLDVPRKNDPEVRRQAVASLGDFVGLVPRTVDLPDSWVQQVRLEPGGRWAALALADGTIRIRTVPDLEEAGRIKLGFVATSLAFAPTGEDLVSIHQPNPSTPAQSPGPPLVRVYHRGPDGQWSLKSEASVPYAQGVLPCRQGVRLVLFNPAEKLVKLVELENQTELLQLRHEGQRAPYLALDPAGRLLIAATPDSGPEGEPSLAVWDLRQRKRTLLDERAMGPFASSTFSPDGSLFACVFQTGVKIYRADTLAMVTELRENFESGVPVAFSSDGNVIAIPLWQQDRLRLWDWTRMEEIAMLSQPRGGWTPLFAATGHWLLTCGPNSLRVYDLEGTREKEFLSGHPGGTPGIAFAPDSKRLASVGKDQTLRIWHADTGRLDSEKKVPAMAQAVAWSWDGAWIGATEFRNQRIHVWDESAKEPILSIGTGSSCLSWGVSFGPKSKYLAWVADNVRDAGVQIWRVEQPQNNSRLVCTSFRSRAGSAFSMTFSPVDQRLAFLDGDGLVFVWDFEGGEAQQLVRIGRRSWQQQSFSPDGKSLIALGSGRSVLTIDARSGAILASFDTDPTRPESPFGPGLCLSPDGSKVAVATVSSLRVDVWDLKTRQLLYPLPEEAGTVWWLAWSPDSERLAVSRSSGRIDIWHIPEMDRIMQRFSTARR